MQNVSLCTLVIAKCAFSYNFSGIVQIRLSAIRTQIPRICMFSFTGSFVLTGLGVNIINKLMFIRCTELNYSMLSDLKYHRRIVSTLVSPD